MINENLENSIQLINDGDFKRIEENHKIIYFDKAHKNLNFLFYDKNIKTGYAGSISEPENFCCKKHVPFKQLVDEPNNNYASSIGFGHLERALSVSKFPEEWSPDGNGFTIGRTKNWIEDIDAYLFGPNTYTSKGSKKIENKDVANFVKSFVNLLELPESTYINIGTKVNSQTHLYGSALVMPSLHEIIYFNKK
ncbi:hypothetical protein C0585_02660 [Candidatus Woesearchaeota archaeon]|nr:MAG: hypothetical protein C0585_02660 [Candidatus Woesearchaeota archaeon]